MAIRIPPGPPIAILADLLQALRPREGLRSPKQALDGVGADNNLLPKNRLSPGQLTLAMVRQAVHETSFRQPLIRGMLVSEHKAPWENVLVHQLLDQSFRK